MMEKIKVLVADDHPAFREGLCRLLKDETDLEVVAMPEDGEEAVESAKKTPARRGNYRHFNAKT
jgi:DNA-binding NarL/FixJ family response regulator